MDESLKTLVEIIHRPCKIERLVANSESAVHSLMFVPKLFVPIQFQAPLKVSPHGPAH